MPTPSAASLAAAASPSVWKPATLNDTGFAMMLGAMCAGWVALLSAIIVPVLAPTQEGVDVAVAAAQAATEREAPSRSL